MASGARAHRARAVRLGWQAVGDAPPHAGRDGRSGARGRFRKDPDGDRSMGHVHGVARAPRGLKAAAASLSLSVLFVAVYGATAWLTSLRDDVGTWSFEWERRLPLVPWLIVPYMSLELFFVAAPFLCA